MSDSAINHFKPSVDSRTGRFLDLVDVMVVALDGTGVVTYANAGACRALDCRREDLIGRSWVECRLPAGEQDRVRGMLRSLVSGDSGPVEHIEYPVISGAGGVRMIAWHNTPLRNAQGEFEGVFCTGNDVTHRQQAEAENRRLQDQLLQSQKMEAIGTLAGGVAHDFNNLLTAIKGYSQLLLGGLDPHDPRREDVQEIETAANRAASLTRQLLLFSHRETPRMECIDVNNLIESLDRMLRRLIGEDVRLSTEPAETPCTVLADAGQIEQIIMNLVINARDAMPSGGSITLRSEQVKLDGAWLEASAGGDTVRRAASMSVTPGDPYVRITVRDTGTGISPEHMDLIFEPFFTTKKPGKGTGLGLSVVYGIVKQHHGSIAVESSHGQGTTFMVYLPAVQTSVEVGPPIVRGATAERGGGERILVVEDEDSVRRVCTRVLRDHGYEVFDAGRIHDALAVFAREAGRFDLIFSDMVLPDGTGLEFVRTLGMRGSQVPVLLTSGYTDEKAHRSAVSEIGMELIHKPYDLNELLLRVHQVLAAHKS